MTRVTVRFGRDGSSIEAVGHAGTKESCAAVSALLGALAGWAENNAGSHRLETGRARVDVPRSPAADAAAELTVIGLLQAEKAAPGDLEVALLCGEETGETGRGH